MIPLPVPSAHETPRYGDCISLFSWACCCPSINSARPVSYSPYWGRRCWMIVLTKPVMLLIAERERLAASLLPKNPREKQFKTSNTLCISILLPRGAYIVILFNASFIPRNDQLLKNNVALTGHNQVYTKGAIYRQMQEYSRKALTAESRLEELHKRSVHHDDHLRIVDAWWRQVCTFPPYYLSLSD